MKNFLKKTCYVEGILVILLHEKFDEGMEAEKKIVQGLLQYLKVPVILLWEGKTRGRKEFHEHS